ncbi:bifunctional [glutamine synthetase] adenylyltransferase/[glutamine synthetase]-adenylyl-L-tyrosine phosphorylase [Dichotomicrobium thermohalophilum]|uniref:Bifunctional glutamine synthetase adenylyltransferase/adenylyl-removing enzyme n=1 Tax=Dichotomicrobium thermohalophilum TaxID=933063 RepID=A0A397Q0N9_9HYPH|nr:bifunctional [glutamine synthetase] adenylyltransferase/[glutamine synthetase]-adenylyl-L-tyrosine phosphorylase [Dichotomicrobium thermohalophilum]RIA54976.1 glutamate-ammonia-ligase adenylyltransferase [Dichotomicrobium thermohalophilum]
MTDTALADQIAATPIIADEQAAANFVRDVTARASEAGLTDLAARLETGGQAVDLLRSIGADSPYLSGLCLRDPEALWLTLSQSPDARLEQINTALAAAMDTDEQKAAMHALRQAKNRYALCVALADLGGVFDLDRMMAAWSQAADTLLQHAVRFCLRRSAARGKFQPADPNAPEQDSGYIVLGMGKYGARELNYSSDIDLIVFYDPERAPIAESEEAGPFFVRLTRELVHLLSERDVEGYVFRTDLRLRPDPSSTQVALSVDAGLQYYESHGQNWERAAFIKARPVAGDIPAGEQFLEELAPFVWRKYLDFATIADVHAMKRQIHAVRGHGKIALHGHNLKLGRGGIREIEFFVQTQQLIAGGRQPELRCRGTLEGLRALLARDWISEQAAEELAEAYRFLRRIEHRLQMIADEQTHALPRDEDQLARVVNFAGYRTIPDFSSDLSKHLSNVEGHYAALFEDVPELTSGRASGNLVFTGDSDDPDTLRTLERMGFQNPSAVTSIVRGWHYGHHRATRTPAARARLTEFLPALLESLAETAQPDFALASFDKFLAELPAGVQLFAMLRNNPALLKLIADIMGSAPRLARVLSQRRRVIDAVLDPGYMGELPEPDDLRRMVAEELGEAQDYQDALDRARVLGQEQQFLIGLGLLSGSVDSDRAAKAYSDLAAILVDALKEQVEIEMENAHGRMPDGQCAVLAMGKLGSGEMTASSDLDLIIVYDHAPDAKQSDGPKPLSPQQYYARLTQRLIAALSAPTAQGALYDVDMRLRPSGHAGPVAVSLDSFIDYQSHKAWTWEHMALTRARVISGGADLRQRIEDTIRQVLTQERDPDKVLDDMRDMRQRIARDKGSAGIWDIKMERGGLLDIEFIAQYKQLVHAHAAPDILRRNTVAVLRALASHDFLARPDADTLSRAAALYHDLTQVIRLCVEESFDPSTAPEGLKGVIARAGGETDFDRVEAKLIETEREVAIIFDRITASG